MVEIHKQVRQSQSHHKGCVEVILKVELSFRFLYAATFSVCAITLVVVYPVMETVVRRWYIQVLSYVPDTLIVFTELQSGNIQIT